ncbi:Magnesium transporter MgtE [Pseudoruegeria aquimaris]|uniref:Magnesium transporter MgtE n=1 Tax=Pseudoruegeria aquimaris TaxID=393663 RepID=A0A1Y5REV2_9RHOB|nr:magnesium transporter [Pseudoruegeria aquimaris]SLN15588.1 Magnesium transporter MgtE [Pseudoruegeria aquimaris]
MRSTRSPSAAATEAAAPLTWREGGPSANRATLRRMEAMLRAGQEAALLDALGHWHPADVLKAMVALTPRDARRLFHWLPEHLSLAVLDELDSDLHAVLFDPATVGKFRRLLRRMPMDEAVATLLELPEDFAEELIKGHPHAEALRRAVQAQAHTIATVMRHGVMTVPLSWTVGELTEDIRRRSDEIAKIDMIFVVDDLRHPVGVLRFRDVLIAAPDTPVAEICTPNPPIVSADVDREEVLRLAEARHLSAIAVVDGAGRLVGGVAPRELAEILREEAEEDMLVMGGVAPASTQFDSPLTILKRRLPWLLAGLVGSSVAAMVIGSFEDVLAQAAILASCIPVVMSTAGNSGIQASTVSVQAITSGHSWHGDFRGRILREMAGAALNGLSVGAATAALVLLASLMLPVPSAGALALTVLVALTLVTLLAGTLGAVVPYGLRALGQDPAVATGIFITTSNDVFGVLIFFLVASTLYL